MRAAGEIGARISDCHERRGIEGLPGHRACRVPDRVGGARSLLEVPFRSTGLEVAVRPELPRADRGEPGRPRPERRPSTGAHSRIPAVCL